VKEKVIDMATLATVLRSFFISKSLIGVSCCSQHVAIERTMDTHRMDTRPLNSGYPQAPNSEHVSSLVGTVSIVAISKSVPRDFPREMISVLEAVLTGDQRILSPYRMRLGATPGGTTFNNSFKHQQLSVATVRPESPENGRTLGHIGHTSGHTRVLVSAGVQ
jgi:hypothetical protein